MTDRRVERDQWLSQIREILAAHEGEDVVAVLAALSSRIDGFRERHVLASSALRQVTGISLRQCHYVSGWLAGEVSDADLRDAVSL